MSWWQNRSSSRAVCKKNCCSCRSSSKRSDCTSCGGCRGGWGRGRGREWWGGWVGWGGGRGQRRRPRAAAAAAAAAGGCQRARAGGAPSPPPLCTSPPPHLGQEEGDVAGRGVSQAAHGVGTRRHLVAGSARQQLQRLHGVGGRPGVQRRQLQRARPDIGLGGQQHGGARDGLHLQRGGGTVGEQRRQHGHQGACGQVPCAMCHPCRTGPARGQVPGQKPALGGPGPGARAHTCGLCALAATSASRWDLAGAAEG
jgi:hypothetical protein